MKLPNSDWDEAILDSLEPSEKGNTIGFKIGEEQVIVDSAKDAAAAGKTTVTDALTDDPQMAEIINCTSAMALLVIKKKLTVAPLTEMDRRIYYEALDMKARMINGAWSVERAAEKEAEELAEANRVGFQMQNATVTVTAGLTDAQHGAITDEASEVQDVCISAAVAITDATGEPSGWYRQIVSKVDAVNGNTRLYPRPVYGPALKALSDAGFPYAGEHPHPRSFKGVDGRVLFDSKVPNQAVRFRKADIDATGNVIAEFKPLQTDMGKQVQAMLDEGLPIGFSNRMTGKLVPARVNGKQVGVAKQLTLYTWDVVLNPAEVDAFDTPQQLTDSAVSEILDQINKQKEGDNVPKFHLMTLAELKAWKAQNADNEYVGICDSMIAAKEQADQHTALTDELNKFRQADEARQAEVVAAQAKTAAQKALTDAVTALPYDQKTKDALLKKGEAITDAAQVEGFISQEKAFVDSLVVASKLNALGVPTQARAQVIDPTEITFGRDDMSYMSIVDNLMNSFDHERRRKEGGFRPDPELRKANLAILDGVLSQFERKGNEEYRRFMQSLTDCVQDAHIDGGVITDSAMTSTAELAQAPIISLAFMRQMFQDLMFAQLVLTEGFQGSTYKIPVEFQTHDIYSQQNLAVGEFDAVPTQTLQTFLLEFGAEWLKRGAIISKEAQHELKTGPFNYDTLARNLAALTGVFQRLVDQRISGEMLAVSDEYNFVVVTGEEVAADEFKAVVAGTDVPLSGSNAVFMARLLCGKTTGVGFTLGAQAPVCVPRKKVWLTVLGRKEEEYINDIVVKVGTTTLIRGLYDKYNGIIMTMPGKAAPDYAVDFESGLVYFTADSGVAADALPIATYAYSTNVSFFSLTIPSGVEAAKFYNGLLQQLDTEKAHMGSPPRYSMPDWAIGSLNAMARAKMAELFYKLASPEGTTLMLGKMWFARRNGLDLGEVNAPWVAGDSRILLGRSNATRFGVGSPLEAEGPFQVQAANADGSTSYTTAKEYIMSQQVAINTPLVIDENGATYHPPYKTIKFY